MQCVTSARNSRASSLQLPLIVNHSSKRFSSASESTRERRDRTSPPTHKDTWTWNLRFYWELGTGEFGLISTPTPIDEPGLFGRMGHEEMKWPCLTPVHTLTCLGPVETLCKGQLGSPKLHELIIHRLGPEVRFRRWRLVRSWSWQLAIWTQYSTATKKHDNYHGFCQRAQGCSHESHWLMGAQPRRSGVGL